MGVLVHAGNPTTQGLGQEAGTQAIGDYTIRIPRQKA